MRIYVDNVSVYAVNASHLDTSIALGNGVHNVVVQAWDSTGAVSKAPQTLTVSGAASGSVAVSSPANGAAVGSPMSVVASASAAKPISSMRVYLDGVSMYTVNAASLNTSIAAANGSHSLVIQAWDSAGAVYKNALTVNVGSSTAPPPPPPGIPAPPAGAVTKTQIQTIAAWDSCTVCAGIGASGPVATYAMTENQASPSLSGHSARFDISGATPYSDALWWKQLGGVNTAKNFKYDVDFFLTAPQYAEALEFDVNQSNGHSHFIFGTQCNIKAGGVWDYWDNQAKHWASTGVTCVMPAANAWHHITWEFQRTDTSITYVAFTIDGATHYINKVTAPTPSTVSEINVAFQMDGDFAMHAFSAWLDNVTLSYW